MMEFIQFEKKIDKTLKETKDKAMAYLNLGNDLLSKDMDPTIPAFKSLHYFQRENDSNGMIQASVLIANHLYKLEEYSHALTYLKTASNLLNDTVNESLKAFLYTKIGFLLFQNKKFDDAIEIFTKSVQLLEELQDFNEIIKIYGTLGFIYQDLGKNGMANEMFSQACNIAKKIGNKKEYEKYNSFIM